MGGDEFPSRWSRTHVSTIDDLKPYVSTTNRLSESVFRRLTGKGRGPRVTGLEGELGLYFPDDEPSRPLKSDQQVIDIIDR